VDILQVETGILTQMLALPYGFKIYSLLTRFNPLNRDRPYALPYRGVGRPGRWPGAGGRHPGALPAQ
jgi:hypothetical protein